MINRNQAANSFKDEYVSRIMDASPALGAAVGGAGAAVVADKLINSEADHAKDTLNVVKEIYRSSPELNQAAAYIYGDSKMSPMAQMQIGKILLGEEKLDGMGASFLKIDHPGVYERIAQVMATDPELARNVGITERLVSDSHVKAITSNSQNGIEEMYESGGSNAAVPLLSSLTAGAGTAAGIAKLRAKRQAMV